MSLDFSALTTAGYDCLFSLVLRICNLMFCCGSAMRYDSVASDGDLSFELPPVPAPSVSPGPAFAVLYEHNFTVPWPAGRAGVWQLSAVLSSPFGPGGSLGCVKRV